MDGGERPWLEEKNIFEFKRLAWLNLDGRLHVVRVYVEVLRVEIDPYCAVVDQNLVMQFTILQLPLAGDYWWRTKEGIIVPKLLDVALGDIVSHLVT